ncbi:hypothetical protein Gorai_018576 [Gossypium raimondii]|uniref:RRM domain-containing protein n=1 Tax=Gossypium raimondii TaxID=29730 RepID=A0A7J8PKN7_GOSRA|nr:hypothetical protein [Gossypium raimondii]
MLESRFRVSLHHLVTGNFYNPSGCSIQPKGFESLKRSVHTSNNDDDFAELGLPVERVGGVIAKLMTVRPQHFVKINGTKKKLNGSPFKEDSCLNIKDVSLKVGNSFVPSLDLENNNSGRSTFRTSSSVTIKNAPSIIDFLELKEAISVFGKVIKVSRRPGTYGLDNWDIEFKRLKSSKKALSVGYITVKKMHLRIWPLQSLETVIVRISNISLETADSTIHSACKLCGSLKGLVRMKEGVVDALFSLKGETDTKSILKK